MFGVGVVPATCHNLRSRRMASRVDTWRMNHADVEPGDDADVLTARPVLLQVNVTEDTSSVVAEAHLQIGNTVHKGVAARSGGEIEHASASATLRAVELAKSVAMSIAEVMYAQAGHAQVAVVVVEMSGMRRPLTGSALVDVAPEDAFARAALDAINRIITDPRLIADARRNSHFGVV